MKQVAAFVLGPESTGNRLLIDCLVKAGCEGSSDYEDYWVDPARKPQGSHIVWGRSLPSARQWPNIGAMVERWRARGFTVYAIVLTRNWWATMQSQVKRGHVQTTDESWANLQQAYRHVFEAIAKHRISYIVCHYDHLVADPEHELGFVLDCLDLPSIDTSHIYDANTLYREPALVALATTTGEAECE